MAIDLVIHGPCEVREVLGHGDVARGGLELVRLLKMRRQAAAAIMAQPDVDPDDVVFTMATVRPDGVESEETVRVGDLAKTTKPLNKLCDHCDGCPGRALDQDFGCVGSLAYPIRVRTERALVDRFEPTDRFGGHLFAQALADFDLDGKPIAAIRQEGFFSAEEAITKDLGLNVEATGDILFQACFAVGPELDPFHCAGILLWLGAMTLDGEVPEAVSPEPLEALSSMADPMERMRRIGWVKTGDKAADLLLAFLHRSQVLQIPLTVDP